MSQQHTLNVAVLTWLASTASHEIGDYLVQRDRDATVKQQPTRQGRRGLARHVLSYAATQAATKAVTFRATRVRVPLYAQVAGTVVEAVVHAMVDHGRLLRRFADKTGKARFFNLASGGVNGSMLMDQAAHKGLQIPLGALVTAALASRHKPGHPR